MERVAAGGKQALHHVPQWGVGDDHHRIDLFPQLPGGGEGLKEQTRRPVLHVVVEETTGPEARGKLVTWHACQPLQRLMAQFLQRAER